MQPYHPDDPNRPATTQDFVQYARYFDGGYDLPSGDTTAPGARIPLTGELVANFAAMENKPERPAVLLTHGGMVGAVGAPGYSTPLNPCTPDRRDGVKLRSIANELADDGYIVFIADFRLAFNDVVRDPALGAIGGIPAGAPGDCIPDDGWQDAMQNAQESLQLAVRSLKWQLRSYANRYDDFPTLEAQYRSQDFRLASANVVAMGVSMGGHLAARLAMRSEDDDSATPPNVPQANRKVSAAVGLSSIGECTASNLVRDFDRFRVPGQADKILVSWPGLTNRPTRDCGGATAGSPSTPVAPRAPDADDAPVQLHNAVQHSWSPSKFNLVMETPYTAGPLSAWNTNRKGWDRVIDARFAQETCDDINAVFPSTCEAYRYSSIENNLHGRFPDITRGLYGDPSYRPTVMGRVKALFSSAQPIPWY